MINVNITSFRKNIYSILEQTIKYNEPVNVSTKDGNAILISEEDYRNLMETLYIESVPGLKEEIINGMKEPLEEYIDETYGGAYELNNRLGFKSSDMWIEISKLAMNDAVKKGFKIRFNLTGFNDIENVFNADAEGKKLSGVTADELRYIQENWDVFKDVVKFYLDEIEVSPPWLD